ncbi:uncharacterized protein KY384_006243 [Bacidia gigantensis]|uniref:uncharacterized protein n=1 Tax=Bacidia gigantensis TaxID=2732470 RepID=UPI001D052119|nr:uncharacterized protein KY384_006243 [Bacidia gigantensis]KAG8529606.1 hypothetical protein KY384_006243 [Bacidia gigantensis]
MNPSHDPSQWDDDWVDGDATPRSYQPQEGSYMKKHLTVGHHYRDGFPRPKDRDGVLHHRAGGRVEPKGKYPYALPEPFTKGGVMEEDYKDYKKMHQDYGVMNSAFEDERATTKKQGVSWLGLASMGVRRTTTSIHSTAEFRKIGSVTSKSELSEPAWGFTDLFRGSDQYRTIDRQAKQFEEQRTRDHRESREHFQRTGSYGGGQRLQNGRDEWIDVGGGRRRYYDEEENDYVAPPPDSRYY